ncbi:hypothetical protein [Kutzneria albida]|uniref:Uncharacterized protein n=1 Tax=Kutzneria albida DSM 43870 TaxID=1449976 RepID=W5WBK0_9PSEU|nr:hypothetical protein [Kutzneria albida]AHH98237.1 hypothetical protein KALB_4875 [Kutzneria albida DSM 43870]
MSAPVPGRQVWHRFSGESAVVVRVKRDGTVLVTRDGEELLPFSPDLLVTSPTEVESAGGAR